MSRLVVIEGLIGVGKTTLCRILEREWGARLVLEPAEDNPFLAQFYGDPARFALPAQLFYLASRYQQQQDIRQADLFAPFTVSDYLYAKDRLFAEMTLEGHELALYDTFARLLPDPPPKPDLVVFLDADTDIRKSVNDGGENPVDELGSVAAFILTNDGDNLEVCFRHQQCPKISCLSLSLPSNCNLAE